jgi:NTP pyrophosphatase (non-canonical NTP hydrolase)
MQFDDYTDIVKEFRADSATTGYLVVGMAAEVGEVCDKFAKLIRDKKPADFSDAPDGFNLSVAKELGDVLWFVAMLADDFGYNLDTIAQMNVEKLSSRAARNQIHGSGDNR